jgi:histidine ammonia-lyase
VNKTSPASRIAASPVRPVIVGDGPLAIEDILSIAEQMAPTILNDDPSYRDFISASANILDEHLKKGENIYGVTTGYGDSCTVTIPRDSLNELPLHLTRFHGCGLGRIFNDNCARAILIVRLASLVRGGSGVSVHLLERLVWLLNENILPLIPEEGSVGASGDLTPLSYVGALLVGEQDARWKGQTLPAVDVYHSLGVVPLVLRPKEGLAIMNGTAVMTALACIAYKRAEYLTRQCARITSLSVLALKGNPQHFHERIFILKPHPGQAQIAKWIRDDLSRAGSLGGVRLQDRYSLRCAPHIIGVLADTLPLMRQFIETELNSSNDNPLFDVEENTILHGGNFYGGHIAYAMDSLKTCVANLADLMDRQMALLVDPKFNHGLPKNISAATGDRAPLNHGFKAVQIGVSAWTAEALKNTMPASVFSRSTENHNQDKVSMGTIAARDCLRVLELTEQVTAALILASVQAVRIRLSTGELSLDQLTPETVSFIDDVSQRSPLVIEDRPLERELRTFTRLVQDRAWEHYPT